jgi:peptidylprolyl isomerase
VRAKEGDTVKVHYTGRLDDGTVFDSSAGQEPLEIKIGEGATIRGLEEALEGMSPGESRVVKVPAEKAYGPHRKSMVIELSLKQLSPDLEPELGDILEIKLNSGKAAHFVVTGVTNSKVTLDANHPLAGKDLTFEIEVLNIA